MDDREIRRRIDEVRREKERAGEVRLDPLHALRRVAAARAETNVSQPHRNIAISSDRDGPATR